MKKALLSILALGSIFGLMACGKKTEKSTNKTTKNSTTTSSTTKVTTKKETTRKTTTAKKTTIDIPNDNLNYETDYQPIVSTTLPRIDINVVEGSLPEGQDPMDFVTKPNRENKWDYTSCTVTVTDNGDTKINAKTAGVKVRGNWTTNYDKKPLRIKFDKKQSMLDLHGGDAYKSWLLLAEYKDWSMLRNSTAFYLAHLMDGNYVSDFRLVNVYINNNFWGVYLLCEQQEVKAGRIEISEAEELEDNVYYTGTDIGYFLEFDGYYYEEDPLQQFTVKYDGLVNYADNRIFTNFQKGFTIKSDIYSDDQKAFIKSYMQNVWNICYNAIVRNTYYSFNEDYTSIALDSTIKNSYEAISKVIDVNSLVNTYLLADIACDTDVAWSSFFMDVDFAENGSKKLKFEAPWDFDSSFGNTKGCIDGKGIYASNIITNASNEDAANPWFMLFYRSEWFRDLVKDKFNNLKEKGMFDLVLNYITEVSDTYEADFASNYSKWNNIGHPETIGWETNSQSGNCHTQKEAANYLKNWLTVRLENLDKLYNGLE